MPRRRQNQPRQRRYEPLMVLAYVLGYQRQYPGQSPAQRRIQRDLDISAPSVVHGILHRLERAGLLVIKVPEPGQRAELTLTEAGEQAARMWLEEQADDGPHTGSG